MNIKKLLQLTLHQKASDLHLSAGMPPVIRVEGDLQILDLPVLSNDNLHEMLYEVLSPEEQKIFEKDLELDLGYVLPKVSRFRVNVFHQQRGLAAAFRPIPDIIPTLDELEFPPIFKEFCKQSQGLILMTGPTGSGKSTTLASMIDYINQTESQHIITVEDPIEFIYTCKKSLINQREVHKETKSFAAALRSSLREDPDIILVGEMRDLETIRLALTAAETGQLVLATLHTNSAAKTIDRIIDVFPGEEKNLVRSMLAESLSAIIAQTLVKKTGGGRIAAQEILVCTPAIRNLIRENKIPQIYSAMQSAQAKGMRTMAKHLEELEKSKKISKKNIDDNLKTKE